MSKKSPIVVSLLGSPGAGKSTLAAYTFAMLKMLGVNCELITEFAKDMTWEQNDVALSNQIYVFAQQFHRMYRCFKQVDVIITDSPLILSPIYNSDISIDEPLKQLVNIIDDKFKNLYFFVNRVSRYNPIGRNHTEDESNEIAVRLKKLINEYNVKYTEVPGNIESSYIIISQVLNLLGDKRVMIEN